MPCDRGISTRYVTLSAPTDVDRIGSWNFGGSSKFMLGGIKFRLVRSNQDAALALRRMMERGRQRHEFDTKPSHEHSIARQGP